MMAKRPPIMINGKRLHECRIDEIVDVASHPNRKRFDTSAVGPKYQNRAILLAFSEATERTTSEIIAKFPAPVSDWSDQFNALRAGEVLGWALEEGIVERVVKNGRVQQHHWRLVHLEQQFETIGRGPRERAIRIHNAGEHQAENAKLWAKELKARKRRRLKALVESKSEILRCLQLICRTEPGFDISTVPRLCRFVVGDIRTIAACQSLIEDSIDDMSIDDAHGIEWDLDWIYKNLDCHRHAPPSLHPSPEDLAELEDFSP